MKAENLNVEVLQKIIEKSSSVGLVDYFRILKDLLILFLLYICMNYAQN